MKLTNQIFKLTAPYNNPYQGSDECLLFVCSVGMLRSPTAAEYASKLGYNTRSCGSTVELALIPLTVNLIAWADKIVFINKENYLQAMQCFEESGWDATIKHKAVLWNIEDDFERNNPMLIKHIEVEMIRTGLQPSTEGGISGLQKEHK